MKLFQSTWPAVFVLLSPESLVWWYNELLSVTVMFMYDLGVIEFGRVTWMEEKEIKKDHIWADSGHFIFYTHDVRARYGPRYRT